MDQTGKHQLPGKDVKGKQRQERSHKTDVTDPVERGEVTGWTGARGKRRVGVA